MTIKEAYRLLRATSSDRDAQAEDTQFLIKSVAKLASSEQRDVVDLVGEALLAHELDSLDWEPLEGVQLITLLLERGGPSSTLMELCLIYLSLYFQELDNLIAACRERTRTGEPPSDISLDLVPTLHQLSGIRSGSVGQ